MSALFKALQSRKPHEEAQYHIVSEDSGAKDSVHETCIERNEWSRTARASGDRKRDGSLVIWALMLLCLCILFASSLTFAWAKVHSINGAACAKRMSAYSPAMEYLRFEWQQFDSRHLPSALYGIPREEADTAWRELWPDFWLPFPPSKLAELNYSTSPRQRYLHISDDELDSNLAGRLEIFHQLHCVDKVRRAWAEDDLREPDHFKALRRRAHVDHCLFNIKVDIECASNLALILFSVDSEDPGFWRPLDSPRSCRRYDKLLEKVREYGTPTAEGNVAPL